MNYCLHIETVLCDDEIAPHRAESVATERGFTHLVEDMRLAVAAVAHGGKSHKGLMEKYPTLTTTRTYGTVERQQCLTIKAR